LYVRRLRPFIQVINLRETRAPYPGKLLLDQSQMFKSAAEPKEADYTEVLKGFKEIFSSPGSRVFIFSFLSVHFFH